MSPELTIVLGPGLMLTDLMRALQDTGLGVSNTLNPGIYAITYAPHVLPKNVVPLRMGAALKHEEKSL